MIIAKHSSANAHVDIFENMGIAQIITMPFSDAPSTATNCDERTLILSLCLSLLFYAQSAEDPLLRAKQRACASLAEKQATGELRTLSCALRCKHLQIRHVCVRACLAAPLPALLLSCCYNMP